ncbi:MAG: hypothetical protein HYZ28_15920 [Myxococcales bacterium]|nr:hypothetical protein [Myxococcales bacterium]
MLRVATVAGALFLTACGLTDVCQRCKDEGRLRLRCHQGTQVVPYCPGQTQRPNCAGYAEAPHCFSAGQVCLGGSCVAPPAGCALPTASSRVCRNRCEGGATLVVDCASFNEQACGSDAGCLGCTWKEPCPEGTVCEDTLGCVVR